MSDRRVLIIVTLILWAVVDLTILVGFPLSPLVVVAFTVEHPAAVIIGMLPGISALQTALMWNYSSLTGNILHIGRDVLNIVVVVIVAYLARKQSNNKVSK